MRNLNAPFTEKTVRELKLGEVISVSGPVVTARDEAHIRTLQLLDAGKPIPAILRGAVLYHCGPIMKKSAEGVWTVIAAGPTTSARMNKLEPRMIRECSIRAVIGKGGMSAEVAAVMKECGCVYLAATGGAAVSLAEGLAQVTGVDWEDLGMAEAVWHFQANNLGPLVVAMDTEGNSLYEQVRERLNRA